ncbi:metallophosphoesterase [Thermostilla marina]
MRILAIGDIHNGFDRLRQIADSVGTCDVALLAGDLTHFGSASDAARIVEIVRPIARSVFAVAGNCDDAEIQRELESLDVSLDGRGCELDDVGFFGLSGIPTWRSGMYQFTEEELAERLARGFAEVEHLDARILLAHVPPRDTNLDRTLFGCHVGSRAVRDFLVSHRVDLCVCGHIHEARGTQQWHEATLLNCGPARRGYYALVDFDPQSHGESRVRVELGG